MTERRTVLLINEISDDDCGMYRLGEIDTLPDGQVEAYIRRHGEFGYTEMLEFAANLMVAAKKSIIEYRRKENEKINGVTECGGG